MSLSNRTQFMLIALMVLALGAGLTAGLLSARIPGAKSGNSTDAGLERTPLVEELGLTPEQRDKMKIIWESARSAANQTFKDAEKLQKSRDDRIFSLLNDEQKAQFSQISKEYADRYTNLRSERDKMFEDAVNETRGLLTDVQKRKYDQILRSQVGTAAMNAAGETPATAK